MNMLSNKIKNKKAQAAVVGLIAAIAIFMVIYFIALSNKDRCDALPELPECQEETGIITAEETENLILAHPGIIIPIEDITHKLSNVELFSQDAVEFPVLPVSNVERNWFSSKILEAPFVKHKGTKSVQIFIGVSDSKGTLKVYVNNKKIATLKGAETHIVSVPLSILQDNNIIQLKSSLPILPAKNFYKLSFLKVKEAYTITQDTVSREVNIEQDIINIKKAKLEFKTNCLTDYPLKISINNKEIISEKICGEYEKTINSEDLQEQNTLTFNSFGNYYLYNVYFTLDSKEAEYPLYYFALNKETYTKIKEGENLAMLYLDVGDALKLKELVVMINSKNLSIETTKTTYSAAINNYLKQGQNSLQLVPEKQLNISRVELKLE